MGLNRSKNIRGLVKLKGLALCVSFCILQHTLEVTVQMAPQLHLYLEALSTLGPSAPRKDSCVHLRRDHGLNKEESPFRQSPVSPCFLEMSQQNDIIFYLC